MKLSGIFAGLNFGSEIAATAVTESEPVKSLKRLAGFSTEILQSGAFDHKSYMWRNRWARKFQLYAARMESKVGQKCAFYDADTHTFDYEYDSENACNGIKMIIDGFSKWSENHLSRCSGQKKHNYNQKRLVKWSGIFSNVLDCEANVSSYTFVIPGDDWFMYIYYDNAEMGESFEFSTLCNPDFRDGDGDNCYWNAENNWCSNASAKALIALASVNEHGILETALNCPQCGCDANGAANLNDVYADKGRKLSIKKN